MKNILLAVLISFFLASPALALISSVAEEDGSPEIFPWQVKVSNDSLTDNGDGTASLKTVVTLVTPGSDADSIETDTPSGMEFISGNLTLIRGCADNEILKWDEAADDWNCEVDVDTGGTGDITSVWNTLTGAVTGLQAGATHTFDAQAASVTIPWRVNATAAPTTDGEAIWDSDGDFLTIGDGVATLYVTLGPNSSTDNAIARFDGTTGKLQNSSVTIDDSDNMTIPAGSTLTLEKIISASAVGDFEFDSNYNGASTFTINNTNGANVTNLTVDGDIKTESTFRGDNWKTTGTIANMDVNVFRTDQDSTFVVRNSDATYDADMTLDGTFTPAGGIHLDDNVNLELGSNTGGDVTIDFNAADVSMERVTGSPDFVINMPLKVNASVDEFSLFGPTPSLSVSDADDMLVSNKKTSATSGSFRGGALVGEWNGTANSTAFIFGLNAGGYVLSGATADLTATGNSGGLVGGRYFARLESSSATVARATAVGGKVEIPDAGVTGTITEAIVFNAEGVRPRDGTITTWKGLNVENGAAGTITTTYGAYFERLTRGTNNYEIWLAAKGGIYFRAASQSIWSNNAGRLDYDATTAHDFQIGGTQEASITANTLTFNAGATDPVLSWSTSNVLALTTGEFQVDDTNTGANPGTNLCIDVNNRLCACGSCA